MHDAYLRLVGRGPGERAWDCRAHFLSAAATAMRRILIERARYQQSLIHGGGRRREELATDHVVAPEPVKRKVALKLIKTGMDSKQVLARFEAERQALALMDHPHIARVLDGGMTPTGQPFFAMELVNGLPLNKFCDEAKLAPRERLLLFVPVCQAIQHAH